jgi:beta-galactosidase
MKYSFALLFLAASILCFGQEKFPKDIYQFIENPEILELGQEPGHVPTISYNSKEDVLLKGSSSNYLSLNGIWKFYYAENLSTAPQGFFKPTFDDSDWGKIKVPGNWEMQGYGDPMFRNIAQPFKANPPKVPRDYNPVGSYRTAFTVPSDWTDKQVFLRMEGSTSATFVWVNGKEVGFNKGANEPAEYNLTGYLKQGKNILAVQVIKYSDGTYLEDQDFWRLSGIFRDVSLVAHPSVHIQDYSITTDLDDQYRDARLILKAAVKNHLTTGKEGYRVKAMLLDKNHKVLQGNLASDLINLKAGEQNLVTIETNVKNPAKWSAEYPNLYYLTLELVSPNGRTEEVIATRFGFKETEIKHQVFLLNGVPIKLNGVNSHMQHPLLGHAMDVETIRKDFILMKQFNINCVRTSHYPPLQEYLDLADEMGIYIIDETGDESHATEFVSEKAEWKKAYVERVQKMVLRDRHHPSILFWSAGNESGFGKNICEVIQEGRHLDPTRYWMYGGNTHDVDWKNEVPCEEIIGPRYPTPHELETRIAQVPENQDPRPSFMDEYIAATGNSLGGMDEFWKIIWQYPRLMGGALWDWVSPGINEKIRLLKDESPNQINTSIKGRAVLAEGKFGKAIQLNGHDQWIEMYRDPKLDISGNQLTLSFWVYPNQWNGNGTFLVKGNYQYGIVQKDEKTLEFYLSDPKKWHLSSLLPENWEHHWHHIAGICDGKQMSLYIDGKKEAECAFPGFIVNKPYPVSIGYNTENDGQEYSQYMSNAKFDRVAVFDKAIGIDRLMKADDPELKSDSQLWLDFETEKINGEYFSLGIGGRSYGLIWPDRSPQPELWQVKKSAQPVQVAWSNRDTKEVEITNHYSFTDLKELKCIWQLTANNNVLQEGESDLSLKPGEKKKVPVPFTKPEIISGVDYRLLLSFQTREDNVWAKKGYEIAFEQLELPWNRSEEVEIKDLLSTTLKDTDEKIVISGKYFVYEFSKATGDLISMKFNGEDLISSGPVLNIWRAPLANETDSWATGASGLSFLPATWDGIGTCKQLVQLRVKLS